MHPRLIGPLHVMNHVPATLRLKFVGYKTSHARTLANGNLGHRSRARLRVVHTPPLPNRISELRRAM